MHCSFSPSLLATLLVILANCSEVSETRIRVVRVTPGANQNCGAPANARNMTIRALGYFAASESTAQSIDLGKEGMFSVSRFPPDTRMIEIEVWGPEGERLAVGRSGEFRVADLRDGDDIPVFMTPFQGGCPTGLSSVTRRNPILVRAGDGALVLGGTYDDGTPCLEVEKYDPSTGEFEALGTPIYGDSSSLGVTGASATALGDGRVVVVGGSVTAFQVYSDDSGEFEAPAFYREARGRHAALALADGRLFLAGGCSQVSANGCEPGSELLTTSILSPETGRIETGPALQISRVGGTVWGESERSVLFVGGVDVDNQPIRQGERIFFDGRPSELIDGVFDVSSQNNSGSVWSGVVGSGELYVIAPESRTSSAIASDAVADTESQFLSLTDGSLLAIGRNNVQFIRGLDGRATTIPIPDLEGRSGQSAIVLGDGSVLIVGGGRGQSSADAFVLRADWVGPYSPAASAIFSSPALIDGLAARDPAQVRIESAYDAHLRITAGATGEEWVMIAGARFDSVDMQLTAASDNAALLLYWGWQSPSSHWKVLIQNGEVPRVQRIQSGQPIRDEYCMSNRALPKEVGRDALSESNGHSHDINLSIDKTTVLLQFDGNEILSCQLRETVLPGQVGFGLLGEPGQSVRVDVVTVGR